MATVYDTMIQLNNVDYGISGIDVGNSRVKLHHDDVFLSYRYDKEWKKNVQHHYRDHTEKRYLIGLSSVNPKQTTAIVKVLQRVPGHLVINIHQLMMRNTGILALGKVENAGLDRLLGAIGAMGQVDPPLITVDCGTAVTINAISEKRTFLGGAIFAGISTQLFGLYKQTAGIPEEEFEMPSEPIGANTHDSLMSGVYASVIGGVNQTVMAIKRDHFAGSDVPVIVTGGEGTYIVDGLKRNKINASYYPHLVTDGIMQLMANAKSIDISDAIIEKIRN
jgi:pantothenate kinase type III